MLLVALATFAVARLTKSGARPTAWRRVGRVLLLVALAAFAVARLTKEVARRAESRAEYYDYTSTTAPGDAREDGPGEPETYEPE